MQRKHPDDITAPMRDNQTWNTCQYCNKSWEDEIPTPGLLHRSVVCKSCLAKIEEISDEPS